MDLGLLGAMLGAAKQGYDEQDYLTRKRRDDDADRQRKQQEFKTQQDEAEQLKAYREQQLALGQLSLDEKKRTATSNDHTRQLLGAYLGAQNTGDWQPFVTAYNSTAGGIHGHQVADLVPNANGSFTATMDNGGKMDFGSADKLLNAAFLMSSPDVYRDSLERRLKAGDDGVEARAKNPKNFVQPIIGADGKMQLLDLSNGTAATVTDGSGNAFSGTLAGKRPIGGSSARQSSNGVSRASTPPTPEQLYLAAVRRGASADKATQIARGVFPNWMQGAPSAGDSSAAPQNQGATAPNFGDVSSTLSQQPINAVNPGQPVTPPLNARRVVRTGTLPDGTRVNQFDDGSAELAQ